MTAEAQSNVTSLSDARVVALEAQTKDLQRLLIEAKLQSLSHEMAHMATVSQWFAERHPRLVEEMAALQATHKELTSGKPSN